MADKGIQTLCLKHLLSLIGKQHGITIKGYAKFLRMLIPRLGRMRIDVRRWKACLQGLINILRVR